MNGLTRTPVNPTEIRKGQLVRVTKPIPAVEAMEYIATKDGDHRGLDCEYELVGGHECIPVTYTDPDYLGVSAEITICDICGRQLGRSDLT